MKQKAIDDAKSLILSLGDSSAIYIGADSEVLWSHEHNSWVADYALAIVVHINSNNGCSVFGYIEREPLYLKQHDKPALRLMTEVYKVAELYLELEPYIGDKQVEIHLDINPGKEHASNVVVQQAIGYIKGVCNVNPSIKPKAFAASYAADRLKFILANK